MAKLPSRLETIEEESAVLHDWPARCGAKSVTNQLRFLEADSVVEEVICRQALRAIKLECRGMPVIAAALLDHGNLRPRGVSLRGIGAGRSYTKFLDGLGIQTNDRVICWQVRIDRIILNRAHRVGLGLVDVHSIERNI